MAVARPMLGISRGSYDPSYAVEDTAGLDMSGLAPPAFNNTPAPEAPVGFDANTNQMFVNGMTFDVDDHRRALTSERAFDAPLQKMPDNFRQVRAPEWKDYISKIKDPTFGRIISKNVGLGVDTSQMLAGSTLQFLGAEETGGKIVKQQLEDIAKNEPYQRAFTDIDSARGAGEWFVANAAQLAPLMGEMIIAAFVGGGVGGLVAAGGRAKALTGIGAKLNTMAGRKSVANTARQAIKNKTAGKALSATETQALKSVGRAAGSLIGGTAASYGVAVGDIYGEMEATGTSNRLLAGFAAIPYAAAEVVPGALAATQVFKAAGRGLKSGNLLKRGIKGFGVGAGIEGTTEVGQDMITLAATDQLDLGDPEIRDQLYNAFAAGAGIGGPIGGIANTLGRNEETDILLRDSPSDPEQQEEVLQLTDQREPLALEAPRLQLEAPNIGGATAIKTPGIIEENFGPGAIAGFEAQRASIQRELDDPNINEERRQDAQSELDSIASILEAIRRQRRGEQAIFQEGPLGITSGDPTTFEGTDPANIVGPDQRQAAEMETNIQSALAQQAAQQAAQQTRQLPVVPTRGTPVQPTGLPPVVAQSDLTATPFALDALELSRAQEPEVIRRQNQEFDEMEAALADQQQGDIRLQEQLPLPTPRQPLRRSPLLKASDEPTLLVERVVDGRSVVEPVPVEEVYQQSATEMQAIMKLQRCLQKSLQCST